MNYQSLLRLHTHRPIFLHSPDKQFLSANHFSSAQHEWGSDQLVRGKPGAAVFAADFLDRRHECMGQPLDHPAADGHQWELHRRSDDEPGQLLPNPCSTTIVITDLIGVIKVAELAS
jgi:hypothetical protein